MFLAIIGTILKIILKIILFLLLLILLLVVVLLFSRLKYSIYGAYNSEARLDIRLSYLFGLLKLSYCLGGEDEGLKLTLPFGIGSKKTEKKKPEPESDIETTAEDFWDDNEYPEMTAEQDMPETSDTPKTSVSENELSDKKSVPPKKAKKEPKKQKSNYSKPKKPKEKVNIIQKIQNGYDKLNAANDRYDIKLLIKYIIRYLGEQLRSIGLLGGRLNGEVGLADPSQTGLLLGGISAADAFLPVDINIDGNFAEKALDIEGEVYGKTYPGKLIKPMLHLLFTKPVLLIIKDILFSKARSQK